LNPESPFAVTPQHVVTNTIHHVSCKVSLSIILSGSRLRVGVAIIRDVRTTFSASCISKINVSFASSFNVDGNPAVHRTLADETFGTMSDMMEPPTMGEPGMTEPVTDTEAEKRKVRRDA
jgi:hypothetical protein